MTRKASMTFFWDPLGFQVRVRGIVQKMERSQSIKYFQSRAIDSQRGAIISQQSRTIPFGINLQNELKRMQEEDLENNSKLECPEYWGGYLLSPEIIEFWINGKNRLHERNRYVKLAKNQWKNDTLYP